MIIEEIEKLMSDYWKWLKSKTTLQEIDNNWVEITTPYLDRHCDYLQIYVHKKGSMYEITDDGYIIADLHNSGCSLESHKRKEILKITLAGFGVENKDNRLCIQSSSQNFSVKKHNLIQAMLAVNDLFFIAKPYTGNLFVEDVSKWFDSSDIRYSPSIKFTGKSGFDHMFNYVIPKSRQQPERLVQTLTNPNKDSAEILIFKWEDTRETRIADAQLFALINDVDSAAKSAVIEAMTLYNIKPILWSEREESRELLAS